MPDSRMLMTRRLDDIVMMAMHRSLRELREGEAVLFAPGGVMIQSHVKAQCQCVHPWRDPENY